MVSRASRGGKATARKYKKFYSERARFLGVKIPKTKKTKARVNRQFLNKTRMKAYFRTDPRTGLKTKVLRHKYTIPAGVSDEAFGFRIKNYSCHVGGFVVIENLRNAGEDYPPISEIVARQRATMFMRQDEFTGAIDDMFKIGTPCDMVFIRMSKHGVTSREAIAKMDERIDTLGYDDDGGEKESFLGWVEIERTVLVFL